MQDINKQLPSNHM